MASPQREPIPLGGDAVKCSALSLADGKKCDALATSADGQFCRFHAKQCFAMYKGYKKRNAELDELTENPPEYLVNSRKKLASQDFGDVEDEKLIDELHKYLFRKHALLDRVIRARRLHHKHFYALTMDYGHEKYLNSLITEKRTVSGALHKCYQRMAYLAFQRQKWFKWARECQEEEDQQRETEQKKIKREAALFRRQAKELDRRMRERRAKEDSQRQEEFLERAYQAGLAERAEDDDNDEDWDPIEDVLENERDTYIELIKYCIWIDQEQDETTAGQPTIAVEESDTLPGPSTESDAPVALSNAAETPSRPQVGKKNKKGKGKGKGKKLPRSTVEECVRDTEPPEDQSSQKRQQQRPHPIIVRTSGDKKRPQKEPDMAHIENRKEMLSRLIEGTKIEGGKLVAERADGKYETSDRMPSIPPPEANRLMNEIAEIKIFLLCRLLLKDAVLLPAAQKACSLDEFFNDTEVKTQDLRDLCLKLEEPQLQDIRDACADFFRVDDEEPEFEADNESTTESDHEVYEPIVRNSLHDKHPLPDFWQSKREKQLKLAEAENAGSRQALIDGLKQSKEERGARIDFGIIDDAGEFKKANLRVKVCGRNIYNYPKQGSMSRRGWLHFSIIAKDCSIWKAVELCKSWDEFFELNILSLRIYFPSPQWGEWAGDMVRSQFLQFGFIPYYYFDESEKVNARRSLRSLGHGARTEYQVRNFMCAQIKRNDPVSRRFIQYTSMQTSRMFLLVRDGKTGELIVSPDKDELWLARFFTGLGETSDETQWHTIRHVGEKFFEEMDELRNFHLGFADFYDVYIWTADPGVHWQLLHASILEMLHKAIRNCQPLDRWALEAPILKTLTVEEGSHRVRDIRKDENVESIWDQMASDDATFVWRSLDGDKTHETPPTLLYTEADALEDSILFPEDADQTSGSKRFKSIENDVTKFESGRAQTLMLARFIEDLDTDEEASPEFERRLLEGRRRQKKISNIDEQEENGDVEDDSSSWEDESESDQESEPTPASSSIKPARAVSGAKVLTVRNRIQPQSSALKYLRDSLKPLEAAGRILDSFGQGPERHVDMDAEFGVHIELWKSKVFKQSWHSCDFEPGAQERWQEYLSIRSDVENDTTMLFKLAVPCAQLLKYLSYHPETHLRVLKDARRAWSIVCLFSSESSPFFKTRRGMKHKSSKLFDQVERSKHLPDRRGFQSCRFREDSFYADLAKARNSAYARQFPYHALTLEMDICIRPKIAQFFNHGLICVSNGPPDYAAGYAFAGREDGKAMDLFFDFRRTIKDINMPSAMVNPYTIPIESLRQDARDFAIEWPEAKFALLRLWSAPHFYPFMLGYSNRDITTFVDAIGRVWAWKFMCKDMAYSEYSVHMNMTKKLEPLQDQLGIDRHKIKVRKDVVLVMGKDEAELLKLTAAATFTVQTQPWRLEIDFWKSFVNINIEFLDNLQEQWWA